MDYELVTVIRPNDAIWQSQKQRLHQSGGCVLSIAPMPDFEKQKRQQKVKGINLLDELTKRGDEESSFLFFNQIPTDECAEIFMNEDRSISILSEGQEIGQVGLYAQTRRHTKEVRYLNPDKTIDYIEEYASDGALYSNLFYHQNQVQEINFYNRNQLPIVTYFFYEGKINFVVVRDPETCAIREKHPNLLSFIQEQTARNVTATDTVTIAYMGLELFALAKTNSHNTLYLMESPITETGGVKENLAAILTDRIAYIHRVKMTQEAADILKTKNLPVDKIEII